VGYTINSAQDEQLFRLYAEHRDTVRRAMGGGVFPKLREALAAYDAFDQALATDLADPDLIAYHTSLMVSIQPYIAQLRTAGENIVATMQTIEAAVPGTFDIPLS